MNIHKPRTVHSYRSRVYLRFDQTCANTARPATPSPSPPSANALSMILSTTTSTSGPRSLITPNQKCTLLAHRLSDKDLFILLVRKHRTGKPDRVYGVYTAYTHRQRWDGTFCCARGYDNSAEKPRNICPAGINSETAGRSAGESA